MARPERFELKIVYSRNHFGEWGFDVFRVGAGLVAHRKGRRELLDLLRSMLPIGGERTPFQTVERVRDPNEPIIGTAYEDRQ